jgi:hypothetical protein
LIRHYFEGSSIREIAEAASLPFFIGPRWAAS